MVKDVAVIAASALLPEIVAATAFIVDVVIVVDFRPMLSGRPFIQDVRGLQTPAMLMCSSEYLCLAVVQVPSQLRWLFLPDAFEK